MSDYGPLYLLLSQPTDLFWPIRGHWSLPWPHKGPLKYPVWAHKVPLGPLKSPLVPLLVPNGPLLDTTSNISSCEHCSPHLCPIWLHTGHIWPPRSNHGPWWHSLATLTAHMGPFRHFDGHYGLIKIHTVPLGTLLVSKGHILIHRMWQSYINHSLTFGAIGGLNWVIWEHKEGQWGP